MQTDLQINPNDNVEKCYETLKKTLWITKGTRFEANRRLQRKNEVSLISISVLSIFTIILSLLQITTPIEQQKQLNISILTIVISIFILVLSNLESSKNYSVRAERMLKCSQGITQIYNRLLMYHDHGALSLEALEKILDEYNAVMKESSENHSNVDFLFFMATHSYKFNLGGFKNIPRLFIYRLFYYLDIYFEAFILNAIPVLAYVLLFRNIPIP